MMIRLLLSILLLGLGYSEILQAETQGEIRFERAGEGVAWQGEQVPIYLELWSDGFSFSGQSFQLPEVSGGYLVTGDAGTSNLSERRGSETWQGLRYDLKFYPQRAGTLEIPSFKVRFSAQAGFGTEPASFEFETGPLRVDVQTPPGATPGATLVSTASFSMQYQWNPAQDASGAVELKVGDALELEVVRTAEGIPGMMFGPLMFQPIKGLGVYPGKPEVSDRSNRGEINSRRVDKVTFVCEKEGVYTLPGQAFEAWNPRTEQLSVQSIPSLELTVNIDPDYQSAQSGAAEESSDSRRGWILWAVAGAIVVVAGLAAWAYRRISSDRAGKSEPVLTEKQAFRQVRKACRNESAQSAYRAINNWLRVSGQGGRTFLDWVAASCDEDAVACCLRFESAVLSNAEWDRRALFDVAKGLRSAWREENSAGQALPRLNPG